jgi:tetratricopeptide (TPR) repeat protein
MTAIPTVRFLICSGFGAFLCLSAATGISAPDPVVAADPVATRTTEIEQHGEQAAPPTNGNSSGADADAAENPKGDEEKAGQDISPRIKAHDRFLFLHDEERYQEASIAGMEVVELTRQEFGADHIKMVTPLVNLAITQAKNGDLQAAEVSYKKSIAIIEKQEGVLSPRLINPLSGLGSTYNRAGLYEQGIETLERALLINHVNEGLYNFEQFKIQDGLTDSYTGMNALEDATFYQEAQVEIHQRKLGADHPDVAISMYKLAGWFELINNTEEAMRVYRKADSILRKAGGDTNAARVEALIGMAHVYERQAQPSSTASTLKKALDIVDAQSEPDMAQRAKIQIALGDLYTRQGKIETSEIHYTEAWQDLSRDDEYLGQRDEYFSEPVRVSGGTFSRIEFNSRGKPAESLKDGFVLISYTVTSKGRASDIKVIESEPAGLMDGSMVSTYKRSYFRPRRVDGNPVITSDLTARHDFMYFKTLEEQQDDKMRRDSAGSSADSERLEYPEKGN